MCSASDEPVRYARPPLVPGRSSPGAAAPPAWSAPDAPVLRLWSPGCSLASHPLRCFFPALPASPPLCFSSGPWCPQAARVRLGGRPMPGWVLLGTAFRAMVVCVWCALSEFAAPGGPCCLAPGQKPWLSPAACLSGVPRGPALVRRASSGPVALGAPVGFPVALVPSPTRGFTGRLRGASGGRPRTRLLVGAVGHCQGRGAAFAGPRWGCPWLVPPASVLGCVRCGGLGCVDPVTDASALVYRPLVDRELGRCTGASSCGRRHLPSRVGGCHSQVRCVSACVCSLCPPVFCLHLVGVPFWGGGGCCPVPEWCPARSPCAVACLAVLVGRVCSLLVTRLLLVAENLTLTVLDWSRSVQNVIPTVLNWNQSHQNVIPTVLNLHQSIQTVDLLVIAWP